MATTTTYTATARDLRHLLFGLDQDMTVREVRSLMFKVDDQDAPMTPRDVSALQAPSQD